MDEPKIVENSVESEIIVSSEERIQSLEGSSYMQARAKRAKFNLGANDCLNDEYPEEQEKITNLTMDIDD